MIAWKSWSLSRKARSPNGPEVEALSEGEDAAHRMRLLWTPMKGMLNHKVGPVGRRQRAEEKFNAFALLIPEAVLMPSRKTYRGD